MRKPLLLCLLAALAACGQPSPPLLNGYVEAEPIRLALPVAGRLVALTVDRGDTVRAGQPLFRLEADNERAAFDEARARQQQAQAQAADLDSGKRPDEIAAIQADRPCQAGVAGRGGAQPGGCGAAAAGPAAGCESG